MRTPLKILALVAALAAVAMSAVRASADFSPVGTPHAFKSTPGIYEWRFLSVRGPSPFDRLGLHRIARGPHPEPDVGAVMLYLPGTNMNGEAPLDDPHHVLPLYLAAGGVEVWTLDYRTHFIPPETPVEKLGELERWTSELFESDIEAAVDFILARTGRRNLFVAGFSRGAAFAYLYSAAHPERVQGLIVLDGFIPKPAGGLAALFAALTQRGNRYAATDLGGRHLTWDKRRALLELVIRNPDAPAPIPRYKTARENLEHVVYDSAAFGGRGGLANPQGGFSDPVVLAQVMILYDRYWPAVQDREESLTAGRKTALAASHVPVLAFSSTNIAPGWPATVAESAHSTGSTDVSVKELKGWGHLDVICGSKAEAEVFAPVAAWIRQRAK